MAPPCWTGLIPTPKKKGVRKWSRRQLQLRRDGDASPACSPRLHSFTQSGAERSGTCGSPPCFANRRRRRCRSSPVSTFGHCCPGLANERASEAEAHAARQSCVEHARANGLASSDRSAFASVLSSDMNGIAGISSGVSSDLDACRKFCS